MEPDDYLRHLRADGAALATAARQAPEAHVDSCPDWDMKDLVGHVGAVHHWVNHLVSTRAPAYQEGPAWPATDFEGILAWYEEGLDQLLATLQATDPAEAVWNWAQRAPAPARFWWRRMAHETSIHRWDGEAAAGGPHPVERDLAVDGIDEYIDFVRHRLAREPIDGLQGSLHLHATDGEGEWSMYLRRDGLEQVRQHIKADAAIRGPVSDLLLWLVNRVPADSASFQVFGQAELVELWRQVRF